MRDTTMGKLSRVQLGAYGEKFATRLLCKLAHCHSAYVSHKRYAGDIKAITRNGTIARIEIKTATLASDKRYHFTLKKKGHTDCVGTNYVILLCVVDTDCVVPFIIPTNEIKGLRAIAITRNVSAYAGKYARYRGAWDLIN